jgi:hypothetical protein
VLFFWLVGQPSGVHSFSEAFCNMLRHCFSFITGRCVAFGLAFTLLACLLDSPSRAGEVTGQKSLPPKLEAPTFVVTGMVATAGLADSLGQPIPPASIVSGELWLNDGYWAEGLNLAYSAVQYWWLLP